MTYNTPINKASYLTRPVTVIVKRKRAAGGRPTSEKGNKFGLLLMDGLKTNLIVADGLKLRDQGSARGGDGVVQVGGGGLINV